MGCTYHNHYSVNHVCSFNGCDDRPSSRASRLAIISGTFAAAASTPTPAYMPNPSIHCSSMCKCKV